MKDKKKREKRLNAVGIACGVFVLLVGIITGIVKNMPSSAGMKAGDIPASAQTLQGVAAGRNGDVKVEVVADDTMIYQIKVTDHQETDGIGTNAVEQMPGAIFEAQSLSVDATSGATLTSDAIKAAVLNALESGGISADAFGGASAAAPKAAKMVAKRVETHSGVTVIHAADWKDQYPNEYNTWAMTSESEDAEDYLEIYPMLRTLYEGYGFAKDYKAARGHWYDVQDIEATGRPHPLANCWTCKTPDFTNMVNEMGVEAYKLDWTEVQKQIVDPISCYTCHENTPGEITITHTYWIDALGEDFDKVDAANMACGQCHNEYYFAPDTKATTIAHNSLESMAPETMLAFFNDGANFSNGEAFSDWTNPRTGVKQIKVQHPEFETFLGKGSQHANDFTCADCHMPDAVDENGVAYKSHNLISPLDNPELIEKNCSACHADLVGETRAKQEAVEQRTYAVGYELEYLTELLAKAVESGNYTDADLAQIRFLARDAQFYWDFVFVENAEGVHNTALTYDCLDKAEELCSKALTMVRTLPRPEETPAA
ncbi:MAG: ammonia-forming cytochrome c nitrite reductase subunit c552 [Oscillospiraceae bacterium]|nr:ammonia-forming cytochrome c nitrite reductase subunit c552 [Oscillospiraceae bacterium]